MICLKRKIKKLDKYVEVKIKNIKSYKLKGNVLKKYYFNFQITFQKTLKVNKNLLKKIIYEIVR